jgi:hypothetical protein
MVEASKRAFIIECVNGNLASGPPRQMAAEQQAADCNSVAAYLELSGSDRTNFVSGCTKPR